MWGCKMCYCIGIVIVLCCFLGHCECFMYPVVDPSKVYKYVPPEEQVTFYLYSYRNLSNPDQLFVDEETSIVGSNFDSSLETKFLIHGWSHGKDVPWLREMREAMANTRAWNVIVVDWVHLSRVIYVESRIHTYVVGKQLALMLMTLKRYALADLSSVHLIGHSMGAQIAAQASLKVREKIMERVARITGLDPAGPLFEWPHMETLDEVLDPTDADFVDVIHTNGGRVGMITPAGHLDFYPNGGQVQPGCKTWFCSHIRAVEYWTASIKNPTIFQAFSYSDWLEYLEGRTSTLPAYPMGILANKSFPSGTYYLKTGLDFKKYIETVTTIKDSYL